MNPHIFSGVSVSYGLKSIWWSGRNPLKSEGEKETARIIHNNLHMSGDIFVNSRIDLSPLFEFFGGTRAMLLQVIENRTI
jgi:hypothetical protein